MNDDIRRLWHDQPREEHIMSIDEIRSKATRFEQTERRRFNLTVPLLVVLGVVEAWRVWRGPDLVERVGDLLTMAALLYGAYLYYRHVAPQSMPAGLGRTSSIEFYRAQLARQHGLASHPWRWLALFIPGVTLSLVGGALDRPLAQAIVIAAFGVALFVAVAWWSTRTGRRWQREIDELG